MEIIELWIAFDSEPMQIGLFAVPSEWSVTLWQLQTQSMLSEWMLDLGRERTVRQTRLAGFTIFAAVINGLSTLS